MVGVGSFNTICSSSPTLLEAMATWQLTVWEGRVIEELRKLERLTNEWRLEVLGSFQHGKRTYAIRPTPFYRVEPKEPLSLAVDD